LTKTTAGIELTSLGSLQHWSGEIRASSVVLICLIRDVTAVESFFNHRHKVVQFLIQTIKLKLS
jgi:hypothetical protein